MDCLAPHFPTYVACSPGSLVRVLLHVLDPVQNHLIYKMPVPQTGGLPALREVGEHQVELRSWAGKWRQFALAPTLQIIKIRRQKGTWSLLPYRWMFVAGMLQPTAAASVESADPQESLALMLICGASSLNLPGVGRCIHPLCLLLWSQDGSRTRCRTPVPKTSTPSPPSTPLFGLIVGRKNQNTVEGHLKVRLKWALGLKFHRTCWLTTWSHTRRVSFQPQIKFTYMSSCDQPHPSFTLTAK